MHPPDRPDIASAKPRWISLLMRQCWSFCAAYLALGLALEVARRLAVPGAARAQELLDGLPIFALKVTGTLGWYVDAIVAQNLSPIGNRLVLSSVGLALVATVIVVTGSFVHVASVLAARRS